MLIPENILQTQLCSECRRYLTVPPIKVYPNRHVKCGRCVQNGDNGVVSLLYQMVVKDFEYPCVNRFEGCTQILNYDEVKKHEENCIAKEYGCPLCNDFNGTAYYLQLHLRHTHLSFSLRNEEAILRLDNGNLQQTYWYCQNNLLLVFFCDFDFFERNLTLKVSIVGEKNRANLRHYFMIYDADNKLQLKSAKQNCSIWSVTPDNDVIFNIIPDNYPSGVAICRFVLEGISSEMPEWKNPIIQEIAPLTSSNSSVSINFSYNIVAHPLEDETEKLYYKNIVCVQDTYWKIYLQKFSRDGPRIGVFLESCNSDRALPGLKVKTSLIRTDPSNNSTEQYESNNKIWKKYCSEKIHWDWLENFLSEDVLENNCVRFEVTLIYEPPKEELSCLDCQIKICEACLKKDMGQVCKVADKFRSFSDSDILVMSDISPNF